MIINKLSEILLSDNSRPVEFILNQSIKESTEYIPNSDASIPRFTMKNIEGFENIPINKAVVPTEDMIIKAIKYGMIFLVTYKGAKDAHSVGHTRVVYPMVLGRSAVGKLLVRVYHLKGWSFSSNNDNAERIWRMFRFDRIKSITFTGSFYRLPPVGYNMYDKGMVGGILARADFNEIRRNQQDLLKKGEIQNKKDIELEPENKNEFTEIVVENTDTLLDLLKPFENPIIEGFKDTKGLRLTLLKSIAGNKYFAIIGALGKKDNTVKIFTKNNQSLGIFKVIESVGGDVLKIIKNIKGNNIFDLYIFKNKK